ncbi:hypothetical protein XI08_10610 [Bradyrhizobium sp. CCBAU 11361]|nr:hypothetical protein [Bradyrhizobium sp. CCBAU 11361]
MMHKNIDGLLTCIFELFLQPGQLFLAVVSDVFSALSRVQKEKHLPLGFQRALNVTALVPIKFGHDFQKSIAVVMVASEETNGHFQWLETLEQGPVSVLAAILNIVPHKHAQICVRYELLNCSYAQIQSRYGINASHEATCGEVGVSEKNNFHISRLFA